MHVKFISENLFNFIDKTSFNKKNFDNVLIKLNKISKSKRCFVSGGYVAYLCGFTSIFKDVDIFIEGVSPIKPIKNPYPYHTLYSTEKKILWNFIYVGDYSKLILMEQFIAHVINNFDIDLCKMAFYLEPTINNQVNYFYIKLNINKPLVNKTDLTEREKKYISRVNHHKVNLGVTTPQKLSVLCILAISKNMYY